MHATVHSSSTYVTSIEDIAYNNNNNNLIYIIMLGKLLSFGTSGKYLNGMYTFLSALEYRIHFEDE